MVMLNFVILLELHLHIARHSKSNSIELNRTHKKKCTIELNRTFDFRTLIFVQLSGVENQQFLGITSVYPGV